MGGVRRRLGSFFPRGRGWGDKLWYSEDRRWWGTLANLCSWGRVWGHELSIRRRGWGYELFMRGRGWGHELSLSRRGND